MPRIDGHALRQLKGDLTTVITRLAEATITLRSMESRLSQIMAASPINYGAHPNEETVIAASCLVHVALDQLRAAYRHAYDLQSSVELHQMAIASPEWAREVGLLPSPGKPAEQADSQPG